MLQALDSIFCDISHETAGTLHYDHWVCDTIGETRGAICSGHWLLCLMISLTKQEVGFCYGHWVLYLDCDVTQEIRVRLATGIGFCVLRYQIRPKRCGFLRAFGSASSDVIYKRHEVRFVPGSRFFDETGGTICYGHWALGLVIFLTR